VRFLGGGLWFSLRPGRGDSYAKRFDIDVSTGVTGIYSEANDRGARNPTRGKKVLKLKTR
jgi:hypothetical protein